MSASIETQNISFSYESATSAVFQDISLSVQPGDVFCLLGPNGIGKSTLLKCLGGILRIREGSILLNGRNLSDYKLPELARKIGYVPQGLLSAFPFRILDILLMGRAPHLGILESPSPKDLDIAYAAMEKVGIVHLADRPCTAVSGGEWQLTLIARALVQEPQILMLDEPTSHLDMGNQMKILQVIHDLAANGMTFLMASHYPDHAFLVANKVALMNKGRILQTGSPNDVITEENLKTTYGIDVRIIPLEDGSIRKACFTGLNIAASRQDKADEKLQSNSPSAGNTER
jgi:iron complex transport system ATP-binding protein